MHKFLRMFVVKIHVFVDYAAYFLQSPFTRDEIDDIKEVCLSDVV